MTFEEEHDAAYAQAIAVPGDKAPSAEEYRFAISAWKAEREFLMECLRGRKAIESRLQKDQDILCAAIDGALGALVDDALDGKGIAILTAGRFRFWGDIPALTDAVRSFEERFPEE